MCTLCKFKFMWKDNYGYQEMPRERWIFFGENFFDAYPWLLNFFFDVYSLDLKIFSTPTNFWPRSPPAINNDQSPMSLSKKKMGPPALDPPLHCSSMGWAGEKSPSPISLIVRPNGWLHFVEYGICSMIGMKSHWWWLPLKLCLTRKPHCKQY